MRPVARGRTLRIERIVERGDAARIIAELGDGFTGRILGTLVYNNKPVDIVLLVEKGSITAASLNSQKTSGDELINILLAADDGFLEFQELDEAGVSLDKEFNTDFILDTPIGLRSLTPPPGAAEEKREEAIAESEEERGAEEAAEQAVEGEEATTETIAGEKEATSEEAVEAPAETAPVAESEPSPASPGSGGVGEEPAAETAVAEEHAGGTEAVSPEAVGETGVGVDAEPAEAAVAGGSEAVEEEARPILPEATVQSLEETIPVRGKGSLEEVLQELRKYVDENAIDKCSEKLEANIINAYLAMVKAEKLLRRMKPSQLLDDITELVRSTQEQSDYIRIVVNLGDPDTGSPRYDLVLLVLQGGIIAALLVDHNNPLEVLLSGRRVFEGVPEEVGRCHVLGGIAHVVSRQAIEPLLGCGQLVRPRERREKRRGFLSRLFGR